MKSTCLVSGALLWSSLVGCSAQAILSSSDFTMPPMKLRAELTLDSSVPSVPSPFPLHSFDTNSAERDVSVSTGETPTALEGYNSRGDRFYLTPILEPAPETPLGRALDSIGRPEVVRLGKATFSSSVVTAVKRKNPLCLLNATFLKLSW